VKKKDLRLKVIELEEKARQLKQDAFEKDLISVYDTLDKHGDLVYQQNKDPFVSFGSEKIISNTFTYTFTLKI
jgi:hypothetical protein